MNIELNRLKALAVAGILAIMGLSPSPVQAAPWPCRGEEAGGQALMWMKAFIELDLSGPQETEILCIIEKYRRDQAKLRSRSLAAGKNLRNTFRASTFDEDLIRGAYQEVALLREEMFILRIKTLSDLMEVLDEEQRARLEKFRSWRSAECRAPLRSGTGAE